MQPRKAWPTFAIVAVFFWSAAAVAQHRWTTYHNARFGTTADYPADLFTVKERPPDNSDGQTFRTADGSATLLIYGTHNIEEDTPRSYVEKYFDKPEVTYKRTRSSFFVVSGVRNGEIFYHRCNFPRQADGIINCLELRYPAKEKAQWDAIVTRVSNSLRSGENIEQQN